MAYELSELGFLERQCATKPVAAMFYRWDCGACQDMHAEWVQAAKTLKFMRLVQISVYRHAEFTEQCNVKKTPQLVFFPLGYKLGDKPDGPEPCPRVQARIEQRLRQYALSKGFPVEVPDDTKSDEVIPEGVTAVIGAEPATTLPALTSAPPLGGAAAMPAATARAPQKSLRQIIIPTNRFPHLARLMKPATGFVLPSFLQPKLPQAGTE